MKNNYRFLFLGDIFGKTGRQALVDNLSDIKEEFCIDFTVANGENIAHGSGIHKKGFRRMIEIGIDVITGGNHTFHRKTIYKILENKPENLLIPANYPQGVPGKRYGIFSVDDDLDVIIVNLHGRALMKSDLDCPFRKLETILSENQDFEGPVFVDFHAEATSEKRAFGLYFDGKITGIFGTHTHIQTSDQRIMKKGTAYITDLGMCGPYDSVIGLTLESVIDKFLYQLPTRFEVSSCTPSIEGVVVTYNPSDNKVEAIERISRQFK